MELKKKGMESKLDTSCYQSNKTVRVWKRREKRKFMKFNQEWRGNVLVGTKWGTEHRQRELHGREVKSGKSVPALRRSQLTKGEQQKHKGVGERKWGEQLGVKTEELKEHLPFKYSSKLERKYCKRASWIGKIWMCTERMPSSNTKGLQDVCTLAWWHDS